MSGRPPGVIARQAEGAPGFVSPCAPEEWPRAVAAMAAHARQVLELPLPVVFVQLQSSPFAASWNFR